MKGLSVAIGVPVVIMLLAGTALAKGGVEQITVTGPDLEQSVEINEPQILDQFDPEPPTSQGPLIRRAGTDLQLSGMR